MSGPGSSTRGATRSHGRSAEEDEVIAALELDRSIERLLADRDRALAASRLGAEAAHRGQPRTEDATILATVDRLARSLVRVHPSFRFEERLSQRLAALAEAGLADSLEARRPTPARGTAPAASSPPDTSPAAATPPTTTEPPPSLATNPPPSTDSLEPSTTRRGRRPVPVVPAPLRHPLVIGGALTSAAISIAGAAFLAWRRTRPRPHPMSRAVRLAHGAFGTTSALVERGPRTDRRRRGRGVALAANLALRALERGTVSTPASTAAERPEPRLG